MTTATAEKTKEIQKLKEQGNQDAAGKLLNVMLKDPDVAARVEAARALAALHNADAAALLGRVLTNENTDLRVLAVESLIHLADASSIEPLIFALRDEVEKVRAKAALGLGQLKDPRGVEPLIKCLGDPSCGMQLEAADALSLIGDPSAMDHILKWTERFYAEGIRNLTHKEKTLIVQNVVGGLLTKLDQAQLMLLTVYIGKTCRIKSWGNAGATPDVADCWVMSEHESPVGKAVKQEMARRKALNGEAEPGSATTTSTGSVSSKEEKLKAALAEATGQPAPAPVSSAATTQSATTQSSKKPATAQPAEPEPSIPMPKPQGIVADFLEFLNKNSLSAFALIGGAVRDSILGKPPEDLDLALSVRIPDQARQKLADPLEWNRLYAKEADKPLQGLAKALDVSLQDLLEGKAVFKSKKHSLSVHYVGPYLIEQKEVAYHPGQIAYTLRQWTSTYAIVADGAKLETVGLPSSSTIDRLAMDVQGNAVGKCGLGLKHLEEKVLHVDQGSEQLGLTDVFHILKTQYRLGASLSDAGVDTLFTAATAVKNNPEIAKGEFNQADFETLSKLAKFENMVEIMDLLHLNGVIMQNLGEEDQKRFKDVLAHLTEAREAALDHAKADFEKAHQEAEEKKKEFNDKTSAFGDYANRLEESEATSATLEAKRDASAKLLAEAEMVARELEDAVVAATKKFREMNAAGQADVNVVREHRKALADKREIQSEIEKFRGELKAAEQAIQDHRDSVRAVSSDMEMVGEELEVAMTSYQEAQAKSEELEKKMKQIEADMELTPEVRRARIMAKPAA